MSREKLQAKLEELLESSNVYYQPPSNIKMEYDAIKYSRKQPNSKFANNKRYLKKDCYEIIVIAKRPDHNVIDKILELPYSSWDRHYTVDNLHHDVLTLYY